MTKLDAGLAVLKAARAKLAKSKWHTGSEARDANGNSVSAKSAKAASFCMIGVIHAVAPGAAAARQARCLLAPVFDEHCLGDEVDNGTITAWNDDDAKTKGAVLAKFDTAIEIAKIQVDVEKVLAKHKGTGKLLKLDLASC